MAEDGQGLDDWLAGLRAQPQEESPPLVAEEPEEWPGQVEVAEEPQEQVSEADMLEDLREQIILTEDEFEYDERPAAIQFFFDLEPWQRLVLAVLLFLDVGLCGCMVLVMSGRVLLF